MTYPVVPATAAASEDWRPAVAAKFLGGSVAPQCSCRVGCSSAAECR